jgi:hypothetical protein
MGSKEMSELTENQAAFEAAKPGYGFAKLPNGRYIYEGTQDMFNDWLENNELWKAKVQITQLQAKIEALKTELHHSSLAATAEAHEVDRINEELEVLRKDAERYQWLTSDRSDGRKLDGEQREMAYAVWHLLLDENGDTPTKQDVDIAIDAAIKGEQA